MRQTAADGVVSLRYLIPILSLRAIVIPALIAFDCTYQTLCETIQENPKKSAMLVIAPQSLADIHRGLDNDRALRVIARSIAELIAVLSPIAAFDVSF